MPVQQRAAWRIVAAIALASALACGGGDGTGPGAEHGTATVISGDGLTDTVGAVFTRALAVQVFDESGRPAANTVVRFDPWFASRTIDWNGVATEIQAPTTLVGDIAGVPQYPFLVDTTDARGRAFALVSLGRLAGPAEVRVTVPAFGYADTAHYTVLPGAPDAVLVTPADSALTIGASFTPLARVRDRLGNTREDPVSITIGGGPLSLSDGRVHGTGFGRGFLVARAAGKADTSWISVVPTATIAAYYMPVSTGDSMKVVVMNIDGSQRRTVMGTGFTYFGHWAPVWHPTEDRILWQSAGHDPRLYTLGLDGTTRRLIQATVPLAAEMWAQYSSDGQWIYFGGRPDHQNGELWRVRSDGTGAERIGPAADFYAVDNHPSPSPDGTRVAYFTNRDGGTNSLRILDLATRTSTPLGAVGIMPRWSPDGQWIAFHVDGIIKVVHPDGSGMRQLSAVGRYYGYGFSWSPDGAWIIASSQAGLEFINVATSETLPVPGTSQLVTPSWRP
jgi:hypothetical protein